MKTKLILIAITSNILISCSTDAEGNKTFLNRNKKQWGDIGFNTGKRTLPIIVNEYKNSDLTSSK